MEPPEKSTASLERGQFVIIISHSNNTVLDRWEEDNLFIVDKIAGPKVSFIQRLCCMLPDARRNPPLEDDSIIIVWCTTPYRTEGSGEVPIPISSYSLARTTSIIKTTPSP